ncbi:TonB-dependent receptor [Compostibacter hankyongensis]|uniref:TonB-dependent receptor n=2 Tax=Compostibacter hankyongensis TaxID=1007089 RepID=A0ABP8FN91_9BACT
MNDSGAVIIGAYIKITGVQDKQVFNAISNEQGHFSFQNLKGSNSAYDISVSYIGYSKYTLQNYKVNTSGENKLKITLSATANDLSQVVVIGYGTVKKPDITGSVSIITTKDLQNQPATRIDQMLQGRAPGVYIKSTNGAPGSPTTIRIRGSRSISATNEPIYVIDGVVDPGGTNLNSINPDDIESIDVLKDASTTAIYGSRASNGVVLITTKKGTPGKESFHFSTNQGFSDLVKKPKMMNAKEFIDFINEDHTYSGTALLYPTQNSIDSILNIVGPNGTNWMDAATQRASFSSYELSTSGGIAGNHGYTYFLSGNVVDQEGIIRNTDFKRYQARFNFTKNFSSKVSLGLNLNVSGTNQNLNNINLGSNSGWYISYLFIPPTMPIHKADGSYETYNPIWYTGGNIDNPVAIEDKITNKAAVNNMLGNFYLQYEPFAGLKLKSTLGVNLINQRTNYYSPTDMPSKIANNNMIGSASSDSYNTLSIINENTATYTKSFKDHHVDFLFGTSYQTKKVDRLYASASGLTNDITQFNNLGVALQDNRGIASNLDENTVVSFLGRANYDYRKRYYLTFTARRDGASNFADSKKWGFFPSGAVKWRIANESFYENSKIKDVMSDLAVRVSYGLSGNQGISDYQSLASLSSNSSAYIFGTSQSLVLGYTQGQVANNTLTWETTGQLDIGLDAEFLNGRLNFTADYYHMLSKDLLLTVQIPAQTGYGSRLENLGKSLNEGFDFSVSGDVIRGRDFRWTASINISTNKQTVTDIGPLTKVLLDGGIGYGIQTSFLEKGVPLGANYGVDYAGTWKTQAEVDNELAKSTGDRQYVSVPANYRPGGPKYVDYNHDGNLDATDYHYLAPANPTMYGGFGSTLSYKRLSLDFFFQFNTGNKQFNAMEFFAGMGTGLTNQMEYMVNRWSAENPNSDIPSVESRDNIPGSRLLHNASLLRLKTAQISYSLKGLFAKNIIKDLNVFVSGNNLLLWTKYNGFDPETNSGGSSSTIVATDNGNYPNSRTITFGANLNF